MKAQAKGTTKRRLRILTDDEIEALYGRPCFTPEERSEYFSLLPTEKAALDELHSIKSRIYFVLQLGYFKAKQLFFSFDLDEVEDDARYIRERYFPDSQLTESAITKVTRPWAPTLDPCAVPLPNLRRRATAATPG